MITLYACIAISVYRGIDASPWLSALVVLAHLMLFGQLTAQQLVEAHELIDSTLAKRKLNPQQEAA